MRIPVPKRRRADAAKTHSAKQEKTVARLIRGFRTPGSGSGRQKGDAVKAGVIRVEAKATSKASYRLKLDDLKKIEDHSVLNGEIPCFTVDFLSEHGEVEGSYAIIKLSDLVDLLEGGVL